MHPFEILLEIIVGRLVLGLPVEDLEKINEMIRKHLKEKKENAEVQEEDNAPDGL